MRIPNFVALSLLVLTIGARADVSIPAIFSQNMVVQQNAKIPVWGWADPGELVQVSLGNSQMRTKADAKGDWRVEFAPLPASTTPITLAIGGRNAIQMDGILIGDVWLAAGDGTMQYRLADEPNGKDLAAQAADPALRFYEVDPRPGIRPKTIGGGYWHPAAQPWIPNTSAVAYFFGQQLRQKLNCPIGVISAGCHAPIESYMSKEALAKIPGSAAPLADIAAREAVFPHDPAQQKAALDDWGKRIHDWDQNQNHPWIDAENAWAKARDAAIAAKQPVPPEPPRPPAPPKNPDGEQGEFTTMYNGMIAPLAGVPIRGVAWYAGEANGGDAQPQYEALLRGLIASWRDAWKDAVPFLIIDMANLGQPTSTPTDNSWAEVRGAQIAVAASTPKAGLVQAIDIGTENNSNPPDKLDVGKRLLATALHTVYGQNVPFQGPRFAGMTVEGNKIRVKYANPDVGLALAASPYISTDPANLNPALPVNEPLGFEVAAADKKWVSAKAQIDGGTMLVWSDTVPNPVAVRYAWASNPPVNLYSKDGFPAVPFRTQDWKVNP
jgi:sialate O-acetylesterase